jgi:hypothetical protein
LYAETGKSDYSEFAGRYPGTLVNGVLVSMVDANSWETAGTGTITTTLTSRTVAGLGTNFVNQLKHGDIIKDPTGKKVGVVKRIINATSFELVSFPTVALSASTFVIGWPWQNLFPKKPGTSDYAADKGSMNDELHIVLIDVLGKITGDKESVIETYAFVSKGKDVKSAQGESLYYPTVLRRNSKYVYWMKHPASGTNWGLDAISQPFTQLPTYFNAAMGGGEDDDLPMDGEVMSAYNLFLDTEAVDVSLIPVGPASTTVAQYVIQNVAEVRRDCVAFVSPVRVSDGSVIVGDDDSAVDEILAFQDALNLSSSYGFMDTGYKYMYDRYNDKYRWVPMSGDIAGLCTRTDTVADPWFSPAGLNRGNLKNVARLACNFDKTKRDLLYSRSVNSVVNFPREGVVLLGDKTLLSKPSAFDRINVRRLFIVLEKAISTASKFFLFEINDNFTQNQFKAMVEPFFRSVLSRRGVTSYKIVVDSTNNTPEVVDNNELVADFYVAPSRSINYIRLNFSATRTGVNFDEIVS